MEETVKAMRKKILSSRNTKIFEDSNERNREIDHLYLMKQESAEDKFPMQTEARCSNSHYKGKYIHWFHTPFKQTFTSLNSVPNFTAKGKGAAENISSVIEAWSLLFPDDLLNIILNYTNQKIERRKIKKCNKSQSFRSKYRALDMLELKAFIGLLYYTGWTKTNMAFSELFSIHNLSLFQATMSMKRFEILIFCLQFDDETTRNERIESDYFTYIREIWNLFVTNCIRYYEPGSNVTIDEYRFEIFLTLHICICQISLNMEKL